MSTNLKCFLCGKKNEVLCFTELSLKKCQEILQVRVRRGFKYADVTVPCDVTSLGYHKKCYSVFTAVKSSYILKVPSTLNEIATSSILKEQCTVSALSSDTNVPEKKCIFCKKAKKMVRCKKQPLHSMPAKNFTKNIEWQSIEDFDQLINGNLVTKVHYHSYCRLKHQKLTNKPVSAIEKSDLKSVIDHTLDYIKEHVVCKKEVLTLTSLMKVFSAFYRDINLTGSHAYSAQHLEAKILKTFPATISVEKVGNRKIVYNSSIQSHLVKSFLKEKSEEVNLRNSAFTLREKIRRIKPEKLPQTLSIELLKKGEVEIPEALANFLIDVIVGPEGYKRKSSQKIKNDVKSLASDLIYTTLSGTVKPAKQIMLGLAMKSMTGCRKVIDVLNKYNQCISYNTLEEIETEICYSEAALPSISPSGVQLSPNLSTGVAFDNFDCYVETLSGKGTLHDTVGIVYQTMTSSSPTKRKMHNASAGSEKIKRRRSYKPENEDLLTPYKKKPCMKNEILPLNDLHRVIDLSHIKVAKKKDLLWTFGWIFNVPNIPMWIGFNSITQKDDSSLQNVFYLPTINESPTSTTVVQETMLRAQKIAQECQQRDIVVTYDLAIAKVAMRIQSTESPKFDNLFIQLGDFHTTMAYFKAVGKFIEECGLPYIMMESDVLAQGSTNSFIGGKHYNRCKRLHPIVYIALKKLHFQRFLQETEVQCEDIKTVFSEILTDPDRLTCTENISNLFQAYEQFSDLTLKGEHGKTAQFYAIYLKFIENYFIFSRAIREGDFELYKSILPVINDIFFAFNQPNYARWLVKYHSDLLQLEEVHPDLALTFKKGCFGIKRKNINFSRSPVDLVLEQTINADAANKLKGISYITNSDSARKRWARNHTFRTEVLSSLFDDIGIRRKEEASTELKHSRMKKDRQAVVALTTSICRHINPFDEEINRESLINIATGKAATEDTEKFLLNVQNIGEEARKKFIEECSENIIRFEKAVKQQKIFTFVQERTNGQKNKNSSLNQIVTQRDYFARLLAISIDQKIDIGEVLKYELTPTPRAFTHSDGTMNKSEKSKLLRHLENMVSSSPAPYPQRVDVLIIDGFFLIHTIRDLGRTYEQLSRKILNAALHDTANVVHVIFDQYYSPSIKDVERGRRNNQQGSLYTIMGEEQVIPKNFMQQLRCSEFKKDLVKFLVKHWQQDSMAEYLLNKIVFVTKDKMCIKLRNDNGKTFSVQEDSLTCCHEEADTRIIYHIGKISQPQNIVVRCNDTDVLIILLGNMENLKAQHLARNRTVFPE